MIQQNSGKKYNNKDFDEKVDIVEEDLEEILPKSEFLPNLLQVCQLLKPLHQNLMSKWRFITIFQFFIFSFGGRNSIFWFGRISYQDLAEVSCLTLILMKKLTKLNEIWKKFYKKVKLPPNLLQLCQLHEPFHQTLC